jgi:phenylacetate-CoA ligase
MADIPLIKDVYYSLRGMLLYQTMLRESCYWSTEKRKAYQFRKLKRLLISASEGVPYYQQIFSEVGFYPQTDFQSLEVLQQLPILSKQTVKDNAKAFVDKRYLSKSLRFQTSGSTGMPMEVFVHPQQWIMEQGVVWRHWQWGGYNFRDPQAMVRSYVPPNEQQLWKTNSLSNFTYFSPFHLSEDNMSRYLDHMLEKKITVIRGYPSSVTTLAEHVLKTSHVIPQLKLILTASEALPDKDREKIEKAFGAKVSNHYGLAEQVVMMGDCEKHEGLHHYDEYGFLELIDTEVLAMKLIVGTNLHNLTTPLIRYDTGDLAQLSEKPCSCTKTLPTIKNIIGRRDATIKTTNGTAIPTVNFYTMFNDFQEIERWQIVQSSLTQLVIKLKGENIAKERVEQLRKHIDSRLNNSGIEVGIEINKPFIQKVEGKINSFVSLL